MTTTKCNERNDKRLIRLQPKEKHERIKLLDFERDSRLFVDVHREKYDDDIKGFFIRKNKGVTVIVNDDLSPREQATVIKRLANGSNVCTRCVVGMIGKDDKYSCECNFNEEV